uniref:PH domain-containing protein n=1 Tax=Labrus bergylta TaxID=56723 RepID=A0A3Q3EK09_9LABR
MTPDLLNFKKGWMAKLDENEQPKKYWFVLSMNSLRFYRDSLAEESSDLEGEIKLTKCFKVSEFHVQRNYGFQIHTPDGVFTLSTMTAGMRRSWIQALMRNVHPANTPDVTSLPGLQVSSEHLLRPDLTHDSSSAEKDEIKHVCVTQRRREGRYRTFDWVGFRSQDSNPETKATEAGSSEERRRSREERRRRYESVLGFTLSPESQQKTEEEVEECWRKVETSFFRSENSVAVFSESRDSEEQLEQFRTMVEDLKAQLEESERLRLKLEDELRAGTNRQVLNISANFKLGFASMEESHLKEVEELQRQHQQEVERLLMERDVLLEEESAATATAIEAIKNAHRVELQREEQKRRQCESSSGNTQLEDIYRRHREELASSHRELQVLSQQFSLRCLEVGHLVQALEAERKALSVCQQENQHLRTRNQELSAHLAAEINRLCSQVKQDNLPVSQRMEEYEMEITLIVKESEVQSLKQETTSLKDELQAAQRDKRNATKKYKEMFTQLSVLRAKTDRETNELRENLRLAHRALDQTTS